MKEHFERTVAFARYLSWADLLRDLFETEMGAAPSTSDPTALRDHQWRWFGLMSYWYASLHVVVEAWDTLGFTDSVVDLLLAHPRDLRNSLRRYRNGVYHFQDELHSPKLFDFLQQGSLHVTWVQTLHDELTRFLAEHLERHMTTADQRTEFRGMIETLLHWYPYHVHPKVDSIARRLAEGRELLSRNSDAHSEHRQQLEEALEGAEAAFRQARDNWLVERAQILRELGAEPNSL